MYTRLFFCGPELDHIHTINAPRWSSSKGCGCFCPHPTAVIVFTPVQMNHFKWKNKPEFDLNALNSADVKKHPEVFES